MWRRTNHCSPKNISEKVELWQGKILINMNKRVIRWLHLNLMDPPIFLRVYANSF